MAAMVELNAAELAQIEGGTFTSSVQVGDSSDGLRPVESVSLNFG
jgi:bacteriocin-like protein